MMPTPDSAPSEHIGLACIWTVKERRNGAWVPVLTKKNVITNYGLSAFAAALNGTAIPPLYIVLEQNQSQVNTSTIVGATSIKTNAPIHVAGDNKIQLSVGTANEETATFSAASGAGPTTYTVTALTKAHTAGDYCARTPQATDDATKILSELSFDTSNPSTRAPITSGYPVSAGVYTYQFYFTGIQAIGRLMTVGLIDNLNFGSGNLYNHVILNYDHTITLPATTTNDVEIDATLTVTNN